MIVYGIIVKGDPKRKLVRARGGHAIWTSKGSAVNAMNWLTYHGPKPYRLRHESNLKSDYEIVEFDLVERKN